MVDKFEETPKILRIEATLHVERDSQKKILIGRKADMLKKIGTQARKELETLLGTKIYLGLFVKVAPDWRENPEKVREISWHTQLEGLVQDAAPEEFNLDQTPHEDAADEADEEKEPDEDPKT
jgi:hypothetical protein